MLRHVLLVSAPVLSALLLFSLAGCSSDARTEAGGPTDNEGDPCQIDEDCDPTQHCEGQVCVDDVEPGEGSPGGCTRDRDCLDGKVCVSGTCRVPAAEGEGEGTGGEGEGEGEGAEGEGEGVATCTADGQEPNDRPVQAKVVEAGTVEALSLCTNDEDWFKLSLSRGATVVITAHGAGAQVELRAPDGLGVVAVSTPFVGGAQAARSPIPGTADYLVRVWGLVPSYSLEVEVTGGEGEGEGEGSGGCAEVLDCSGSCSDQACLDRCLAGGTPQGQSLFETMYGCWQQNCADATGSQQEFNSCVQQHCATETVACQENTSAGGEGEGEGAGSGTQGCSGILTCAGSCQDAGCMQDCMDAGTAQGQSRFSDLVQCIEQNCAGMVNDEQAYQACVQQACSSQMTACYMDQGGGGSGGSCSDDGNEPDDGPASANPLAAGMFDAIICPGNSDYWKITVPAGATLDVALDTFSFMSDFSLYLGDASGNVVAESATFWQATEQLTYWAEREETLYVVVNVDDMFGVITTPSDYTLYVDVTAGGGGGEGEGEGAGEGEGEGAGEGEGEGAGEGEACVDDGLEPNDDGPEATPVLQPGVQQAMICSGNPDLYVFTHETDGPVSVRMVPGADAGDLDIELGDSEMYLIEGSDNALGEAEELALPDLEAGDYYLAVYGYEGDSGSYTLTLDF